MLGRRAIVAAPLIAGVMLSACGDSSTRENATREPATVEPATEELLEGSFQTSVAREDAAEADVVARDLREFPLDMTMTIGSGRLTLTCGPPGAPQRECAEYSLTVSSSTLVLLDPDAQVILRLDWELQGDELTLDLMDDPAASGDLQEYRAFASATFESHPWTRTG